MPARIFISVDLPVPLPPTKPIWSLDVISQSTFSKRSLWPKRFPAPESWIMGLELSSHKTSGAWPVARNANASTTKDTKLHEGKPQSKATLHWRWDLLRKDGRCADRDRLPRVRCETGFAPGRGR